MIVFIQYLIRFSFTEALNMPHALDHWYYALGVLCSVLLAAGGYIVNDLFDLETDTTNKPKRITIGKGISEDRAWYLYFSSVILAAVCAYFLAHQVALEGLWLIAPLASLLLYLYATNFKKRPLIGNILVSLLSAMPVFLVAVFDLLPAATEENAEMVQQGFRVLMYYAAFAFWLTLIREIVKDMEDRKGDTMAGYQTLAIIMPERGLKAVLIVLIAIALAPIIWYAQDLLSMGGNLSSALYILLAVALPLVFIGFRLMRASVASDFHRISSFTKIVMLLGILSMPFFTLSLLYQWP
ncbi:geranylgeranylglycerol-phosphate geranylgeranyltransferase [Croceimicrobium sp.]|uniref:geranylgeranylglycerol-phosphate geranylgeranyltransferase n=1 Tax=Croceimicrobium sp. TaxID=2828340 RepID=UPI003BAAC5D6